MVMAGTEEAEGGGSNGSKGREGTAAQVIIMIIFMITIITIMTVKMMMITVRSCVEVARRQFAGSRGITGKLTIALRRYKSMNARLMSAERGFKGSET